MDIGNAVMARQPFVDECVIRIEQRENASVLANDAFEEQFGFALERLSQIVIEFLRRSLDFAEFPQVEPLTGEVVDKSRRLRIRKHSADLLFAYFRIAEAAFRGGIEKFIVGNTAPQKKGQT